MCAVEQNEARSFPETKHDLVHHIMNVDENKIYIPISLRKRIVWWYHTYLQHPGITRMEATLRQNLTWSNLKKDVEAAVKNCHECQ
jgi:hypothetical protein